MAYSGPIGASTLDALLQALVNWAVANAGFTDEGNTTPPGGRTTTYMYRLSKGGMYWYFMGDTAPIGGSDDGYIEMRCQTVLPTSSNYALTSYGPNQITRAQLWRTTTGPYLAYNFFTDGTSVHVVIETVSGVFCHFSFGKVTKFGSWTGGEYTTAHYMTNWSDGYQFSSGTTAFEGGTNSGNYQGFVYYPYASQGNYLDWAPIRTSEQNNQFARFMTVSSLNFVTTTYNQVLAGGLFWAGGNTFNQRAAMIPQYLMLHDETINSLFLAGYADHVKFVNCEFIAPKDIVEVEWEVFPLCQKYGDNDVAPITENLALAYRRA